MNMNNNYIFDDKLPESVQVLSVVYGPLVGEKENSLDKYNHDHTFINYAYHTLMRHPHYDCSRDTEMMDNSHN